MTGFALNIELSDYAAAQNLNALADYIDPDTLELVVAATVESQMRYRIAEEKAAPDGTPWADWSEEYAKTRHSGHSLLQNDGDLLDSLYHDQSGGETYAGSNLVYAAIQNFGDEDGPGKGIPAREFAGVSDENETEIDTVIADYMQARGVFQ